MTDFIFSPFNSVQKWRRRYFMSATCQKQAVPRLPLAWSRPLCNQGARSAFYAIAAAACRRNFSDAFTNGSDRSGTVA